MGSTASYSEFPKDGADFRGLRGCCCGEEEGNESLVNIPLNPFDVE